MINNKRVLSIPILIVSILGMSSCPILHDGFFFGESSEYTNTACIATLSPDGTVTHKTVYICPKSDIRQELVTSVKFIKLEDDILLITELTNYDFEEDDTDYITLNDSRFLYSKYSDKFNTTADWPDNYNMYNSLLINGQLWLYNDYDQSYFSVDDTLEIKETHENPFSESDGYLYDTAIVGNHIYWLFKKEYIGPYLKITDTDFKPEKDPEYFIDLDSYKNISNIIAGTDSISVITCKKIKEGSYTKIVTIENILNGEELEQKEINVDLSGRFSAFYSQKKEIILFQTSDTFYSYNSSTSCIYSLPKNEISTQKLAINNTSISLDNSNNIIVIIPQYEDSNDNYYYDAKTIEVRTYDQEFKLQNTQTVEPTGTDNRELLSTYICNDNTILLSYTTSY
ncbi:MAG: hypothetical protein BKP49_04660 [Treponema sp. CETP13]|nr:MAG: hypothetical protein BKP49_04660 [Treponema sp. CETP13]